MRQALQSFTPVAHPLNYDALASREGCEAETGIEAEGSMPFVRVCVFGHSPLSLWHNQLDTVSYSLGPNVKGVPYPLPYRRRWAVWVAGAGIRVAQIGSVTPPANTVGSKSGLYPDVTSPKVTHAFDSLGLLHIAIERPSPNFIETKWYTDTAGTIASITFAGRSPVLYNLSNIEAGAPSQSGVALYYLKSATPFKLYARFSGSNFATEYAINADLRVGLSRLISARQLGDKLVLYAIDEQGRDVTLTSASYSTRVRRDKTVISIGFENGTLIKVTEDTEPTSSKSKVTCKFESGAIYDAVAESSTIEPSKSMFAVEFDSGDLIPA